MHETMQTRMSLRQNVMRWALQLIVRHEQASSRLRKIIGERFRQFSVAGSGHYLQKTASANLDFALHMDSTLKVPQGRPSIAPSDLAKLLPPHTQGKILLMQQLMIQGRQYCTSNSEVSNNSQVIYKSVDGFFAKPGQIKYIFYSDGQHMMAIHRLYTDHTHPLNIFRKYPDFPATIAQSLPGPLDLVPATDEFIRGHYAQFPMNQAHNLIVDLSRVRSPCNHRSSDSW
jgi:hypothetical protein